MGSAAMRAMDSADSEAYYGLCRLDLNTSVACVMAVQSMSAIRADRMTSHKMIVVLVVFRLKVMLDSSRIRICILKETVVKGLSDCYHIDAFLGRTKPFEWPTSNGVSSFFYALLLLTVFRAESSFNTHKSQRGENLKKMDRGGGVSFQGAWSELCLIPHFRCSRIRVFPHFCVHFFGYSLISIAMTAWNPLICIVFLSSIDI